MKHTFRALMRSSRLARDPASEGFSLPLAITVGLILLLGGMALANRVGFSVLGSVFQGQGLAAREAAETGAERIIAEINMPANRRFLLSSTSEPSTDLWSAADFAAGSTLSSVCVAAPQTLSNNRQLGTSGTPPTTGPYPWVYLDGSGKVTTSTTNAARAYRLVGVQRQPFTKFSGRDFNLVADAGWKTFGLIVDGATINNGEITSTIRLEKEYQVMPKCCNTSFGRKDVNTPGHGRIEYEDGDGNLSQECLKGALGFGLVGGSAENNTGEVVLRGKAEANSPEDEPIPIVYCVVNPAVGGDCAATDSATNLDVRNVFADMPNIPLPPSEEREEVSPELAILFGDGRKLLSPSPGLTLARGSTNCTANPADFCSINGSTLVINAGASVLPPSACTKIIRGNLSTNGQTAEYSEVHCLVKQLKFSNPLRDLRIAVPPDSGETRKKLILYFIDQDPSSSETVIQANGNGKLLACTTPTGQCTSPPDLTDVSFLGCPSPIQIAKLFNSGGSVLPCTQTPNSQTVQLGGTPDLGEGGGVFIWFPNGNIKLIGTSSFTGVAWGNTVSANGTVDFIVPGSGLGDALTYSRFYDSNPDPGTGGSGGGGSFPIIDFVARATNNFRWCNSSNTTNGC